MKFYLSSFKIGNAAEKLMEIVPADNKKTAYIPNALDSWNDADARSAHEEGDMDELRELGFEVERFDLHNYFDASEKLEEALHNFGLLWISGGNTFVLRQAMHLSGFDEIIHRLKETDIVYGGYSAGICILAPTLRGLHIVDNPDAKPYGEEHETVWEGLGLLDYSIAPHYDSDHPESSDIDKEIAYCKEHSIPCRPLRDGEVIFL